MNQIKSLLWVLVFSACMFMAPGLALAHGIIGLTATCKNAELTKLGMTEEGARHLQIGWTRDGFTITKSTPNLWSACRQSIESAAPVARMDSAAHASHLSAAHSQPILRLPEHVTAHAAVTAQPPVTKPAAASVKTPVAKIVQPAAAPAKPVTQAKSAPIVQPAVATPHPAPATAPTEQAADTSSNEGPKLLSLSDLPTTQVPAPAASMREASDAAKTAPHPGVIESTAHPVYGTHIDTRSPMEKASSWLGGIFAAIGHFFGGIWSWFFSRWWHMIIFGVLCLAICLVIALVIKVATMPEPEVDDATAEEEDPELADPVTGNEYVTERVGTDVQDEYGVPERHFARNADDDITPERPVSTEEAEDEVRRGHSFNMKPSPLRLAG